MRRFRKIQKGGLTIQRGLKEAFKPIAKLWLSIYNIYKICILSLYIYVYIYIYIYMYVYIERAMFISTYLYLSTSGYIDG